MKPVRLLVRYLAATLLGILLAAVLSLAIFGVDSIQLPQCLGTYQSSFDGMALRQ